MEFIYSLEMMNSAFTPIRKEEIIRCKDCEHSYIDIEGNRICNTDEYTGIIVKDNDFCSYGEKRESK